MDCEEVLLKLYLHLEGKKQGMDHISAPISGESPGDIGFNIYALNVEGLPLHGTLIKQWMPCVTE